MIKKILFFLVIFFDNDIYGCLNTLIIQNETNNLSNASLTK